MQPQRYALRRPEDATHPDSMRATLSELLSTFIFVFVGEGSILALNKVYSDTSVGALGLTVVALAHALALFAVVAASMNVSGGHVNLAVTFSALVGGRVSLLRAFYCWVAQLLGAVLASLFLSLATNGMRPVGFAVAAGVGNLNALLMEMVLTFGLGDPKRGSLEHLQWLVPLEMLLGTIAPLAISFIVGANILVEGPFEGSSMNPDRAFGQALVGWRWNNHWIYWLGPFVGAGIAGLIYEFGVIQAEPPNHTHHQPLAPEDY